MPGGSWAYSNIGFMLVVEILERVTGQTFAQVLAQLVTQPLALQRTLVLETMEDLMACVPGFGSEVTEDGNLVDVRDRYHPGWVVIDHGAGVYSLFAHLSSMTVAMGDVVSLGTELGHVGATGRATGPHLHWGVRLNGARVDPLSLIVATNEHTEPRAGR